MFVARRWLFACGVMATLLFGKDANGQFLGGCCGDWGSSRTTYAPPYAPQYSTMFVGRRPAFYAATTPQVACAPVCAPAPVTCSYVPQTSYRTTYRLTPVTAYRPVAAGCDPCTGCPVTAYRPVTTFVRQAQLVPYTSYRLVYSNACQPACSPCTTFGSSCATGRCGLSVSSGTFVPSSGCASCAAGSLGATTMAAPAAPAASTFAPSATPTPAAPTTQAAPATPTPAPSTLRDDPSVRPTLKPIPDANSSGAAPTTPAAPQLLAPENRSAARPALPGAIRLISSAPRYSAVAEPSGPALLAPAPVVDDEGWRPARRATP